MMYRTKIIIHSIWIPFTVFAIILITAPTFADDNIETNHNDLDDIQKQLESKHNDLNPDGTPAIGLTGYELLQHKYGNQFDVMGEQEKRDSFIELSMENEQLNNTLSDISQIKQDIQDIKNHLGISD